jgi:hypothetical protein
MERGSGEMLSLRKTTSSVGEKDIRKYPELYVLFDLERGRETNPKEITSWFFG